ncbi:hypothetical protein TIFTF001_038329 [Ficus carica]|uniref:Ubiquitin-like protease family profile domain-containing protein n=1 Tax=Ficus carica TaxID=3494 RepID=A0AA88E741_FICCA|nr:hypothetical protein TIFTF001_038329 [Ficus carica]
MVSDAGLKRKQGEMDVKDSKKLISALEDKISKSEEAFHNIVMRLTDHSGMSDALCFELGEDLGRFSINELCLITGLKCVGSTHLPVMSNSKFDNDDDAVKLSLLYIIFCIPLSNASSVKIDPKFFVMADNLDAFNDFPWGMLSWEATRTAIYTTSIASKFTTKYDQAIPRMMSWTTADNVMFDDIFAAFTTLKCFALMPTEEELKNPWVARLYSKKPKAVPQLPPPKSYVPRPSTNTKFEWRDFQKEIRGQVASLNNKLEDLKKEQKTSNLAEGSQNTTSPDIGAVTDMGVQAAMEFLTADKIPKKKRARLSRLGQRLSSRMTEVGSPSKAPSKLIYALPPGLADEPPKETLDEFREWINKGVLKRTPLGKWPPRNNAKHETLDKPHDLGFMVHIGVAFYYLRKKIKQFPELEQRKVTTVDTFFSSKVRSLWHVYQSSPDKFDWGSCESILKIMLGVCVQSGSSWFEVNTLLIPIHLADLKHWALVKLDLTSWTIEVYDSLQHEGPHNSKVREGVECISMFIPLLAERLSLFDFKPREPPESYPIPVTIMKDIPQQANGGDCGMLTIKYAECLIEGRDVRYWVIHGRIQLFREWLTCYFCSHAKRKIKQNYKSDDDVDMDFA